MLKIFDLFSGCGGFRAQRIKRDLKQLHTVKLINMQRNFTTAHLIQKENYTLMTQQKLFKESFPILTCFARGFLASLSQLQEKDRDLKTQEAHSFLKSHGFLKTNDPNILFSKTLKAYLITTEAKLSKQYLKFSPTLGIAYNGNYLILSSSEYLKTGKECTLLDVMEKNVPEKYFLSPEAIQKIIAKSE